MRSGVTEEDLARSLYEITVRLPNAALEALYQSDLGSVISKAAEDQNWWFGRTEHLVNTARTSRILHPSAQLVHHIGDWSEIYKSLIKYGFTFMHREKYTLLLVQVLLGLGVNPLSAISNIARTGDPDALKLILDSKQDIPEDNSLAIYWAVLEARIENVKLLMANDRFTFSGDELPTAVRDHELEIVKLLLENKRIDPTIDDNEAIFEAAKYGYADIFELLIQDYRVRQSIEAAEQGDRLLSIAIEGKHIEVAKIILDTLEAVFINSALLEACRIGSYEIVNLLLDRSTKKEFEQIIARALRVVRNLKLYDIEKLLLSKLTSN